MIWREILSLLFGIIDILQLGVEKFFHGFHGGAPGMVKDRYGFKW
jgi:hypothetical protein